MTTRLHRFCNNLGAAIGCAVVLSACSTSPTTTTQRQESEIIHLKIIGFNDFHGALRAQETGRLTVNDPENPNRTMAIPAGGAAFLATQVKQLRAQAPYSLVISSGDLFGASPLTSALYRDEGTIEVMNALGLDYNALGNHEFDRGPEEIQRLITGGCATSAANSTLGSCAKGTFSGAQFKFLSVNALNRQDGSLLFTPYEVRTFGGVKIGIIGAVLGQAHTVIAPQPIKNVRFDDDVTSINRAALALKQQGVQLLILSIHQGGTTDSSYNDTQCLNARGEIFRMAPLLDPAIAVILSAHTHQAYNCRVPNTDAQNWLSGSTNTAQRVVISSATNGRLVADVDLKIDATSQRIVSLQANNRVVTNDQSSDPEVIRKFPPLKADPLVAQIVDQYAMAASPKVNQLIGRISAAFTRNDIGGGQSALGRLITEAQLTSTRAIETGGAQLALTNPGSLRSDIPMLHDGRVTYGMLYGAQPFGNALVTLTLTGAQFKALLEQQWVDQPSPRTVMLQLSGNVSYRYDLSKPIGERVIFDSMTIDHKPVALTDNIRVTANQFLVNGGDGFTVLLAGKDQTIGVQDLDALISYMRSKPVHSPIQASNIQKNKL